MSEPANSKLTHDGSRFVFTYSNAFIAAVDTDNPAAVEMFDLVNRLRTEGRCEFKCVGESHV